MKCEKWDMFHIAMNNLSPKDRETLDNFKGMTVGQIFKKARESQNASIEQISKHLNITLLHLEAIEENDINAMPTKVYAVGFVRAYADLLGLDSEKMAYLFKVQFYGKKQTDHQKQIVKSDGKNISLTDMIVQKMDMVPYAILSVIGIIGAISGVVFLVILFVSGDGEHRIEIPEVPSEMMLTANEMAGDFVVNDVENKTEIIEPMDITVKPEDGAESYGAKPFESSLAFKILKKNWIEFRAVKNGEVLLSKTLNAGDVFYAQNDQDILVTVGDGSAVEVYLDNQSLGMIGKEKEIIRLRPLSVKALRLR